VSAVHQDHFHALLTGAGGGLDPDGRAFLDTLMRHSPIGVGFFDRAMRFRMLNGRLAEMNGVPVEAHLGRTPREVLPDIPPESYEPVFARALAGEATTELEVSGITPAVPGVVRHWLESVYPVRGPAGEVIGVGVFALEVTHRRRAEERVLLLAEISRVLDSRLGLDERLDALGGALVPRMADGCVIDVEGRGVPARRVSVHHVDPATAARLGALPPPLPESPRGRVARTGIPELVQSVTEWELRESSRDPGDLERRRALGTISSVVAPLVAREGVLGTIALSTTGDSGRRYDEDDLALTAQIGARAGLAIDNALLYEERRHVAEVLQASLLPARLGTGPGLEAAARYVTAGAASDVGGDVFDAFTDPAGRTWALMGDVCGRGPEAAAVTALARYTVRAVAPGATGCRQVMDRLNEELLAQRGDGRFIGITLVEVDPGAPARVVVLNAGMEIPLLVSAAGAVCSAGRPGSLLGIQRALDLTEVRLQLTAGDALVLFTDGVVSSRAVRAAIARGDDPLLRTLVDRPPGPAEALAARVMALAPEGDGAAGDDAAVLVLRAVP
jgi:PAS domain S-box-containing protein